MPDMSKLVDLNGIAAVRDWANQKFSGGGGSSLPSVTSEDNGDLLSVVDGAWAKSEPGYRVSEVAGNEIVPEQSVTAEVVAADHVHADIFTVDIEEAPEKIVFAIDGTAHVLELSTPAEAQVLRWGQDTDEFFVAYDRIDHAVTVYMPASMEGTHTISVSEPGTRDVVPSSDFKLAVNNSYMETTESEKEAIPEQSVTTAVQEGDSYASGSATDFTFPADFYSQELWPTTLHVTFNGTEYDLPKIPDWAYGYGAVDGEGEVDFTTYPCIISFSEQDGDLYCYVDTEAAGTYTLSATYTEATTAPTEKFKEAVRQSGGGALIVNDDSGTLDKTWQEIFDAYTSGTAVVIRQETFLDNGGDGDALTADYYPLQRISADTITTQGEETVTYYVYAVDDRYETSSADDYPYINAGGGGGES